jgi:TrbL/VirB6 plasmid conjugal transfer protein
MIPSNALGDAFAYLTAMMTANAPFFLSAGTKIFDSFAVILVAWFGVQWALAGEMRMERFANMLVTVSFGFAMMHYYSNPIPGFGVSFYHLIVDEGTYLANQLNQGIVTNVYKHLDALYFSLETPGLSVVVNILEGVRWLVTVLCIDAAEIAVFFVISFGYVATGVLVLLGPIFIPFFIAPTLEWMFWGWLKSLVQYAFYPVVANAYVFVFGSLLINFVDTTGPPYDGAKIAVLFGPLVFILIAFSFGVLKVPTLVNSMFTGRSGESALPWPR